MTPEKIQLSNRQWAALREMVVVKQRKLFPLAQLGAMDGATLAALQRKGAVTLRAGMVHVTDEGEDAVMRMERLHEKQSRA